MNLKKSFHIKLKETFGFPCPNKKEQKEKIAQLQVQSIFYKQMNDNSEDQSKTLRTETRPVGDPSQEAALGPTKSGIPE